MTSCRIIVRVHFLYFEHSEPKRGETSLTTPIPIPLESLAHHGFWRKRINRCEPLIITKKWMQ
jgi:hypothetical protein